MLWRSGRRRLCLAPDRVSAHLAQFTRGCATKNPSSPAPPFRVLFFGTDDFSLETLKALRKENLREGGCVSKLEVCLQRTKHLVPAVRRFAEDEGLRAHHYPPPVAGDAFDVGVVASFGKLISRAVIESFPRGVLNVHGSLLPRWRGATPIQHCILHGDAETGISIMEVMPHHFDVGCVLASARMSVPDDIFREDLSARLARLGAGLMVDVLRDLDAFEAAKRPQPEEGVTQAPLLDKRRMLGIRWESATAEQLWRTHRAVGGDAGKFLASWPPTESVVRLSDMLNPADVQRLDLDSRCEDRMPKPGRVLVVRRGKRTRNLCVRCADGRWAAFGTVQVDRGGKGRPMDPLQFYNGFVSKEERAGRPVHFGDYAAAAEEERDSSRN